MFVFPLLFRAETLEAYMRKLIAEKLKLKDDKTEQIAQELDQSPQRLRLTREKTYKKKQTFDSKIISPEIPDVEKYPPTILAKMKNDREFTDLVEDGVDIDLVKEFVAKQIYNNYQLTKQLESCQSEFNEKNQRLQILQQKLKDVMYSKNSDTEDTTPRGFEPEVDLTPASIILEKLHER